MKVAGYNEKTQNDVNKENTNRCQKVATETDIAVNLEKLRHFQLDEHTDISFQGILKQQNVTEGEVFSIKDNSILTWSTERTLSGIRGMKMVSFSCTCIVLILPFVIVQHVDSSFSAGGSVYTRWGHNECPRSSRKIYSGFAGGSHYSHHGAAVEPLCLPKHPQWGRHNGRTDAPRGFIYGAEYEVHHDFIHSHLHDQDVPCAVCQTRRGKDVMVIPARTSCYRGWRKEYSGYLMTGRYTHPAASTYSCVDQHPRAAVGGHQNHNGYLFYLVEARCGSLKCPPYHSGWEITCVVCSKL